MRFSPAPHDHTDPCNVQRWRSQQGHWYIEITRVIFGYRVRVSSAQDGSPALDYCAGADREWVEATATVLMLALVGVPEAISGDALRRLLPWNHVKPLARDPACWQALCALAQVDPTRPLAELADVELNVLRELEVALFIQLRFSGLVNTDHFLHPTA